MANIVTVEELKAHANITFDVDDALLANQIAAAQAHLETQLGYAIADEFTTVPDDLKQAVKMLAAHWYENREAAAMDRMMEPPFAVQDILNARRRWWGHDPNG